MVKSCKKDVNAIKLLIYVSTKVRLAKPSREEKATVMASLLSDTPSSTPTTEDVIGKFE